MIDCDKCKHQGDLHFCDDCVSFMDTECTCVGDGIGFDKCFECEDSLFGKERIYLSLHLLGELRH